MLPLRGKLMVLKALQINRHGNDEKSTIKVFPNLENKEADKIYQTDMDRRKKRALSHTDLEQIANESFSESGGSDEFYEPSSSDDENSDLEDDTEAEADGAIATSDSEGVENEVIGNVERSDNPDGVIDPDVVTEIVVHPNSEVGNVVFVVFHATKETKVANKKNSAVLESTNSSIYCYEGRNEVLPDIATINPLWERSIYFLEVSCRSSNNGKITILPRQACAIESAAFNNPNFDIHLLYASSGKLKNEGSLSDRLLQILQNYKNIKILSFDFQNLVKDSPAESLYKNKKIQSAAFPVIVASDISRLLILQKYGGIYLDLDVIVIKPLEKLGFNYAGLQSNKYVNNAVLSTKLDKTGDLFTRMCLEELEKNFVGNKWEFTGPVVLTKILKRMCNVNELLLMSEKECQGFKIFPTPKFYPIAWQNWSTYFINQESKDALNYVLENSYVVYVWNKFSKSYVASENPNSIYNTLAKKFCPYVYEAAGDYF
ncbi:hypothetical protein RN001_000355 [Aquatica leii]|uniref:Alpha 1,4-glycosyltransferase domain-containing protein n=1 Tax=Aquatica leii TaxID=1421715 RepID=A0AAN7SKH9_9COLE|nr:hypothetical protein RN001_000355 [Aquatica leii]